MDGLRPLSLVNASVVSYTPALIPELFAVRTTLRLPATVRLPLFGSMVSHAATGLAETDHDNPWPPVLASATFAVLVVPVTWTNSADAGFTVSRPVARLKFCVTVASSVSSDTEGTSDVM